VLPTQPIPYPTHGNQLEHEAELVVLIGKSGKPTTEQDALSFIAGLSLGLDLTLRDVQAKLKEKGLPWEMAKSFDGSAPVGLFTAWNNQWSLDNLTFSCDVNGDLRQSGQSKDMVFTISQLLVELAKLWMLQPGDLIYTGTPAGVGRLHVGDEVTLSSELLGEFTWNIN